jgi:hypothetical protein
MPKGKRIKAVRPYIHARSVRCGMIIHDDKDIASQFGQPRISQRSLVRSALVEAAV